MNRTNSIWVNILFSFCDWLHRSVAGWEVPVLTRCCTAPNRTASLYQIRQMYGIFPIDRLHHFCVNCIGQFHAATLPSATIQHLCFSFFLFLSFYLIFSFNEIAILLKWLIVKQKPLMIFANIQHQEEHISKGITKKPCVHNAQKN